MLRRRRARYHASALVRFIVRGCRIVVLVLAAAGPAPPPPPPPRPQTVELREERGSEGLPER
jgi:hypothetical protein